MQKKFIPLFMLAFCGTVFPVAAQMIDADETYMNWSYASGIETPRPPEKTQTTVQSDASSITSGGYTYDNYYAQTQTTNQTMPYTNMGAMGGSQNVMGMNTMGMTSGGVNTMAMTSGNMNTMGMGGMMANPSSVFTQITPAQAQSNMSVQYVNNPVKVQYPITKQYPVSVQYPVTVQRDITVQRPVVMQQPVVVQRPVVMQQPVMVQHQPMMVQQQPIYMQQQPTFVQQQPVVVQADGMAGVQSMPAYAVTGFAVQSAEGYPAAYVAGN